MKENDTFNNLSEEERARLINIQRYERVFKVANDILFRKYNVLKSQVRHKFSEREIEDMAIDIVMRDINIFLKSEEVRPDFFPGDYWGDNIVCSLEVGLGYGSSPSSWIDAIDISLHRLEFLDDVNVAISNLYGYEECDNPLDAVAIDMYMKKYGDREGLFSNIPDCETERLVPEIFKSHYGYDYSIVDDALFINIPDEDGDTSEYSTTNNFSEEYVQGPFNLPPTYFAFIPRYDKKMNLIRRRVIASQHKTSFMTIDFGSEVYHNYVMKELNDMIDIKFVYDRKVYNEVFFIDDSIHYLGNLDHPISNTGYENYFIFASLGRNTLSKLFPNGFAHKDIADSFKATFPMLDTDSPF